MRFCLSMIKQKVRKGKEWLCCLVVWVFQQVRLENICCFLVFTHMLVKCWRKRVDVTSVWSKYCYVRHCSEYLDVLTRCILTKTPRGKYYYCPHFPDEKTEAERALAKDDKAKWQVLAQLSAFWADTLGSRLCCSLMCYLDFSFQLRWSYRDEVHLGTSKKTLDQMYEQSASKEGRSPVFFRELESPLARGWSSVLFGETFVEQDNYLLLSTVSLPASKKMDTHIWKNTRKWLVLVVDDNQCGN